MMFKHWGSEEELVKQKDKKRQVENQYRRCLKAK